VIFEELLSRRHNKYTYSLNLAPGAIVPDLFVEIDVYNSNGLLDASWKKSSESSVTALNVLSNKRRAVLRFVVVACCCM
jgi:hypothetical protein